MGITEIELCKLCIFCGARPSEKTREHVIPQWLLKMTGNPNRSAFFGRDWLSPTLDKRVYSWKSFTFPACDACNNKWSDLEAKVQDTVIRMLEGAAVSAADLHLLLDWFDKVRTGLWLGMLYLNRNYRCLIPQFYINERVGQKDRVLLIFESLEQDKGIALTGCDTPVFHTSPSVCRIGINHLDFVTVSSDFLLAERFGWPFVTAKKSRDIDTDGFEATLEYGTRKFATPIITSFPELSGRIFLQPIAHQYMRHQRPDVFAEFYSNDFVKNSSLDPNRGIGQIYLDNLNPVPYPSSPSDQWKPSFTYSRSVLGQVLGLWVAQMQKSIFLDMPDYSHFPEEDRKARDAEIHGIVAIQDLIISHVVNGGM